MVKIPVESHGLHRHRINKPWLGTMNFMELQPVCCEPYYKAEKVNRTGAVLSRLNAITNPAFATGRYEFRGFFVPYRYVWRPWYFYHSCKPYKGVSYTKCPYTTQGTLSKMFRLGVSGTGPYYLESPAQGSTTFDVSVVLGNSNTANYNFTTEGARLFKLLVSLGMAPTFVETDTTEVNLLKPLCYLKIFLDYYYPRSYVGDFKYNGIEYVLNRVDDLGQGSLFYDTDVANLLEALFEATTGFYQDNVFDLAFDNPLGGNNNVTVDGVSIVDNSVDYPYGSSTGSSPSLIQKSVVANDIESNQTPVNQSTITTSNAQTIVSSTTYKISKFLLDSIESLSLFMKRHQLAGGRLLDYFLASRGMKLGHDAVKMSYYLGKHDIEIEVSAVENNSDTNLGELAGKAIASSSNSGSPHFEFEVMDDGLFFVLCFAKPDCDQPIFIDPWNYNVRSLDHYHAAFDKLGAEAIPTICSIWKPSGVLNALSLSKVFGFYNRYYSEVNNNPVLTGDFIIKSRGADSLSSYHTMRLLGRTWSSTVPQDFQHHSINFVDGSMDMAQYQRLFYSEDCDNMQLFIRWFGDSLKNKLPLGDSFDWDDDEFNRKVDIDRKGF